MMVETPLTSEKARPDKVTSALAATTAMKQDRRLRSPSHQMQSTAPPSWMPSQRSPVSGAQGTTGAEQHLAQDSGDSWIRQEVQKSSINGLPSGDGNTHGMFFWTV